MALEFFAQVNKDGEVGMPKSNDYLLQYAAPDDGKGLGYGK
ncbi:hypothetical protein [Marinobacterium aestuariivivens]|uniref:Uncharacterized protein n=1 Tax=Marinobacterium aestuariivivens TaxID=1698799 RepID=A0ABW2A9F5_9GAMM